MVPKVFEPLKFYCIGCDDKLNIGVDGSGDGSKSYFKDSIRLYNDMSRSKDEMDAPVRYTYRFNCQFNLPGT